ncbi:transporter substrate-binding domain-containing protein [Paraburkholderia sp. MMS20-SJTN17]|uniref:histidine kinase n=1 Tax=Paraburkholderia translucens TaxID=2886945 RepID=A0ABS8KHM2_9BURK|nr:transporter substrate-binding domain-containing protein [Paraburkholderia sp. MMS20-SJTN17]MCC8404200.1 transporter substrate-binding domain-containing protein [Paraburkholderia sp. MMS20-SJTN17]
MHWLALGLLAAAHAICPAAPNGVESGAPAIASGWAASAVQVRSLASSPAAFPDRLTVGMLEGGWPPFEIQQDGRPAGVSGDLLRALVGPHVIIETKTYADMAKLIEAACSGQVDLLMSMARTPQRERCLNFTAPYFRGFASAVVRRDENRYANSADLAGARIAIERGFARERLLRDGFPHARIVSFASTQEALTAVLHGDADLYIGFAPVVQYELATEAYRGLRVAFEPVGKALDLRFAVAPRQTALRDQLNRALVSLNPAEAAEIRERWLSGNFNTVPAPDASGFTLTPEEQNWLRSLPPLRIGFDKDWAPFSYVDDAGRPLGLTGDYLAYLSSTLGIVLNRSRMADWPATVEAFQRGDLAMLATASSHGSLLEGAEHTRVYERDPLVIVGRSGVPPACSFDDFTSCRIVMSPHVAGSVPLAFEAVPVDHIAVAASLDDALRKVASGEADVAVGNAAAINAQLRQHYTGALRVLGTLGESDSLYFAVREDLSPLVKLIDRALQAMPAAERERIRRKWVRPAAPDTAILSVTAVRLLPVLIGIGVVLLVTLRAYVLLQREVRLRKQTERELALQLSFQETMMQTVPYPLTAKGLDGRYIAINEAYEKACGLDREAVLGRTTAEVGAWGDTNSRMLDDMTREVLRGGGSANVELQFEDGAGESRHGLFWTRVCKGTDGQPAFVLGTMVDITDIRRAEMRARETERRLFDVTRSLPAVVFQLRRSPAGAYSFPYIGGDTRHLLGGGDGADDASPGLARVDFQRVSEVDRPLVLGELERSASRTTPVHMEFRLESAGTPKWVRAELVPRREADGSIVWSGYGVDASAERARAEELARARDVAEAASRAKDHFFAMMSHEIRTPMNGVLGLVEVLERTPLSTDQSEMLGMIHESAGALLQILDDLLDYSKIEAGRLTLEAEPIDLRELVDNAVGLLAGRAHEKGLKVRVDIAALVAATLRSDSVRLRQILFNLLGNAIKFTPKGEVGVSVSIVEDRADSQTLDLTVQDTGIGIAPDVQAGLFEPFVQAESSTTRRFGGTGLGLTICRKLTELMNGTLTLRSEVGRGTSMIVRLTMPVVARRYPVNGLRGKLGVVITPDPRIGHALVQFGEALALEVRGLAPDAATPGDVATLSRADLLFVGEDVTLPVRIGANTRVITLTEKPNPTGYRILDDKVRVCINPISWRGLGAACAAAITGLPSMTPAASRAAGVPFTTEGVAPPPDRERAIASGRLILVAEDHPVNQELIRHQLALLGFACDVANDGAEALAALERTNYGCLITDCHMPNLSGYELTRRIREAETSCGGAQRLPILGITANTAPHDLSLCREAGMDDSLVKPTRLATLRDCLSRWFGTDSVRQAAPAGTSGRTSSAPPGERPVPQSVGAGPFVPIELSHMTQLWGSEATVKALLGSFVSSMRDDLDALATLLERADAGRLREWLHRATGAASVVQYPPLVRALKAYGCGITAKSPEQLRDEGHALILECEAMLDGIEQQAALLT